MNALRIGLSVVSTSSLRESSNALSFSGYEFERRLWPDQFQKIVQTMDRGLMGVQDDDVVALQVEQYDPQAGQVAGGLPDQPPGVGSQAILVQQDQVRLEGLNSFRCNLWQDRGEAYGIRFLDRAANRFCKQDVRTNQQYLYNQSHFCLHRISISRWAETGNTTSCRFPPLPIDKKLPVRIIAFIRTGKAYFWLPTLLVPENSGAIYQWGPITWSTASLARSNCAA